MRGTWDRDRDPLAALGRGRSDLFEEFVRAETPTLIGFFQRLGGSRAESEDLAQEVFVKLYRQAATYQPQGTFEAFALRIARNAWIDRRRRESARVASRPFSQFEPGAEPWKLVESRGATPEGASVAREDRARIAAALKRLSANHALIFELAVVQARPYPEIAVELDIPVGTVKSRVFHALRQLRAALAEEESNPPSGPGASA